MASGSFAIKVEHNALEASAWVKHLAKKQAPFVMAATLTEVAKDARDEQRDKIHDRFTVRARRFPQSFRHVPASKGDWPNTRSIVGVLDEWVARHERGGTVRPSRAGRFAVPGAKVKRTKTGKVRASQKPGAIMSAGRGFIRDGILFRRKGRKKKDGTYSAPPVAMFMLRRRVRLEPRLLFVPTVTSTAGAKMDAAWQFWMRYALR